MWNGWRDHQVAEWIILFASIVIPISSEVQSTVGFNFHQSISACQKKTCATATGSTKVSDPFTNCRCDGDCVKYGDCCYDAPIFSLKEEPKPAFECVDLLVRAVYMKTECPDHLRESDIGKSCRDPSMADPYLTLPVTNNKTFTTYRNSFCARCHNEKNFVLWNFELYYLEEESDYEELDPEMVVQNLSFNRTLNSWGFQTESTFLKVYLAPSPPTDLERSIRQCKPNVISICAGDWRNSALEKLCNSYTYIVHDSKVSFRNPHCAECNNVALGNLSCMDSSPKDGFDFNNINHLSGIFSIHDRRPSCQDETYDIFTKKCRDFEQNEPLSICSKVIIKSGNYKLENKSEIIIPIYDKKFPSFEANITENGDMLICAEALGINDKSELNIGEIGEKMISFIGYTLSALLLLIHLIVFIAIGNKKLSKCNIASLSLALLVAYTTLLVGNSFSGKICYTTSIVSLYSLLSSFMWMFTISYDIWRLVRSADKGLKGNKGSQHTRLTCYSLLSWTVPLLFVGTSICIDNSSITPVDWKPLFGLHTCWFGQRKPLIVFFVLPFIVLTVLNTLMFTQSAYIIYIIKKEAHSSKKKRKFKMYMNLALTVGLTWTTGLIAMVFGRTPVLSSILWYVFTFVNAFQGVFIFINFTCGKKLLQKLKELRKKYFDDV